MRLLADENIPLEIVESIKENGIKIARVDEIKNGLDNENIIKICLNYECILITFNKQIAENALKNKIKGIVLLDFKPYSLDFIEKRIKKIFKIDLEKKMIIIKEDRIIKYDIL
ncbi:MAG TPA: DUF5615 family PIN-like protein [Spirochaetota bacterium]|nr:DUF5615 family PIN-like protein [Spirochaetota bacterium]HOM38030.1 DUF5615 family PIN-like protein [Spirochaetota bacterium]HPQ48834.1 DUF5615 family PIN-like protein [Spirochaetota bacterium]